MKIKKELLSDDELISLDEFKLWARIDNDEEDELLLELIKSGIEFFEIKTNQVLKRAKFTLLLENEKTFYPPCDEIQTSGEIDVKTEFNSVCFSGSGRVSFISGFKETPLMIKLWIKNFALNLYEKRINDYKNDAVINFYKIKEF